MEQRRAHDGHLLCHPERHQAVCPVGLHAQVTLPAVVQLQAPGLGGHLQLGEPPGLEDDTGALGAEPRLRAEQQQAGKGEWQPGRHGVGDRTQLACCVRGALLLLGYHSVCFFVIVPVMPDDSSMHVVASHDTLYET